MNNSNELLLMLVNTLRKDLDATNPAWICLALDTLVLNCPTDAIPAVTPRLLDLLAHDSPHVKRKALAAVRKAALQEPELLLQAHVKLPNRIADHDSSVVEAAFRLLEDITRAHTITSQEAMDIIIASNIANSQTLRDRGLRLRFIEVTGNLISKLETASQYTAQLGRLMDIYFEVMSTATVSDHALIFQCFRALSSIPIGHLLPRFQSPKPLALIARLLVSYQPNIQYLCMACLEHLPVEIWAGVTDDIPAAFNEGQVNNIMSLLDSRDSSIRRKTLQVLYKVDKNILLMHLTGLISTPPTSTSDELAIAQWALEVAAVYEQEGFAYATRLQEVCARLKERRDKKLVFEDVVEQVLLHLRTCSNAFNGQFVDGIICIPAPDAGPTLTLVMAAVVCEYSHLSAVPHVDVLHNLSQRLDTSSAPIQEALLLTMLRVTAHCTSGYSDVSSSVRELHRKSRRHIQRRCMQYINFSNQLPLLQQIVERAKSNTLPDFILALETAEKSTVELSKITSSSRIDVQLTNPKGKLRYDAYEPPRPAPKFSTRRSSSHSLSSRSNRSESIAPSSSSYSRERSVFGPDDDAEKKLSRTLTAGDLALAAHDPAFAVAASPPSSNYGGLDQRTPISRTQNLVDLSLKTDLIALDSPFLVEPAPLDTLITGITASSNSDDFESAWKALKNGTHSRGWSEYTAEELETRLNSLLSNYQIKSISAEIPPYSGETKLILLDSGSPAALTSIDSGVRAAVRIRPDEESSALWQMRCLNAEVKAMLLNTLNA
ncbi:armadillo-type protein [Hysterangium stoloniferum]|nr:armadillo-type protein [Hysterangium stoloniferum]